MAYKTLGKCDSNISSDVTHACILRQKKKIIDVFEDNPIY